MVRFIYIFIKSVSYPLFFFSLVGFLFSILKTNKNRSQLCLILLTFFSVSIRFFIFNDNYSSRYNLILFIPFLYFLAQAFHLITHLSSRLFRKDLSTSIYLISFLIYITYGIIATYNHTKCDMVFSNTKDVLTFCKSKYNPFYYYKYSSKEINRINFLRYNLFDECLTLNFNDAIKTFDTNQTLNLLEYQERDTLVVLSNEDPFFRNDRINTSSDSKIVSQLLNNKKVFFSFMIYNASGRYYVNERYDLGSNKNLCANGLFESIYSNKKHQQEYYKKNDLDIYINTDLPASWWCDLGLWNSINPPIIRMEKDPCISGVYSLYTDSRHTTSTATVVSDSIDKHASDFFITVRPLGSKTSLINVQLLCKINNTKKTLKSLFFIMTPGKDYRVHLKKDEQINEDFDSYLIVLSTKKGFALFDDVCAFNCDKETH